MGEANARSTITGYLTKKEQVHLGMASIGFGRVKAAKPGEGEQSNRQVRAQKLKAVQQFGVDWVAEQFEVRNADPAFNGKSAFDPEQVTNEKVAFTVDRDVLGWVVDELDRVPAGDARDTILAVIEDRLMDMKRGAFQMPAELLALAPAPTNGAPADLASVAAQ